MTSSLSTTMNSYKGSIRKKKLRLTVVLEVGCRRQLRFYRPASVLTVKAEKRFQVVAVALASYYCGVINRQVPDMASENALRGRQAIQLTGTAPAPLGAYSHAVKAAGLLFVSGQGARDAKTGKEAGITLDADGRVTAYDIEVQTRAVLDNLSTVLAVRWMLSDGSSGGQRLSQRHGRFSKV